MQRINILREVEIFQDLNESQLKRIEQICEERICQIGAVIFEENTASDELYIIATGMVDIRVDPSILGVSSQTGPATIATLRRGQTFGEVALVDQGLRSASARCAANNTRLLVINRDDLIALCEQDFQMGYVLMRNIAADLSFKIRSTDLMVREQLLWHPSRGDEGQNVLRAQEAA
jgi:CRP/FNR family cyclic AMP-dependent transcriptional regulator